jgi:hypothetical protein
MPWWKKKKINETRMEFLERGRVEYMELENKRLCIKEEKIHLERMKEERERMKEKERETLKEETLLEEAIMTRDVDTLPLVQQEYFHQHQLEILGKRRSGN